MVAQRGILCSAESKPRLMDKAQEHLAIAATMYREMGMLFWLEGAEAET